MSPAWPLQRVAWASFGTLALLAGAVAAYVSMGPAGRATQGAFVFRALSEPRALPDLAFEDGDGRKRVLADFRGRTVLLNLWATWCVPCREEMPALDRLQRKLGGPGFEVVALSIDKDGAAAVRRFYGEIGIRSLGVYVDPTTRVMDGLGIVGIPTTVLVDAGGREIGRRSGAAQWDGLDAVRLIEAHLARAKP